VIAIYNKIPVPPAVGDARIAIKAGLIFIDRYT